MGGLSTHCHAGPAGSPTCAPLRRREISPETSPDACRTRKMASGKLGLKEVIRLYAFGSSLTLAKRLLPT